MDCGQSALFGTAARRFLFRMSLDAINGVQNGNETSGIKKKASPDRLGCLLSD
jgi:hypothetical protein